MPAPKSAIAQLAGKPTDQMSALPQLLGDVIDVLVHCAGEAVGEAVDCCLRRVALPRHPPPAERSQLRRGPRFREPWCECAHKGCFAKAANRAGDYRSGLGRNSCTIDHCENWPMARTHFNHARPRDPSNPPTIVNLPKPHEFNHAAENMHKRKHWHQNVLEPYCKKLAQATLRKESNLIRMPLYITC